MIRSITALGERLLNAVVPQAEAAAVQCGDIYCNQTTHRKRQCCQYPYGCYDRGPC